MHISDINNTAVLVSSFTGLRQILDAEMKDVHATGIRNTQQRKNLSAMMRKSECGKQDCWVTKQLSRYFILFIFTMGNCLESSLKSIANCGLIIDDITIENKSTIVY